MLVLLGLSDRCRARVFTRRVGEDSRAMKTGVFSCFMVLVGVSLATAAAAHHPGSFMMPARGHTNGDVREAVTVTDGVQMLRAAAGLQSACEFRDGTDVYYMASCDMNGDGHMTVSDGVRGTAAP